MRLLCLEKILSTLVVEPEKRRGQLKGVINGLRCVAIGLSHVLPPLRKNFLPCLPSSVPHIFSKSKQTTHPRYTEHNTLEIPRVEQPPSYLNESYCLVCVIALR